MTDQLPTRTEQEAAFDALVAKKAVGIFQLTNSIESSVCLGAHLAAADLRADGTDPATVEALLTDYLSLFVDRPDEQPVSQPLQAELVATFVAEGGVKPKQMLLEHLVKARTGYRMFIWPNESKHPGMPHVTVALDGEKINVLIAKEPRVLAGKADLPGIGKVLKAIAKHRNALLKEWRALRPDDQKIRNFKAKRTPRKRVKK